MVIVSIFGPEVYGPGREKDTVTRSVSWKSTEKIKLEMLNKLMTFRVSVNYSTVKQ